MSSVKFFIKNKKEEKTFHLGISKIGYRCRLIIHLKFYNPDCYKVLDIWGFLSRKELEFFKKPKISEYETLRSMIEYTDVKLFPTQKFECPNEKIWIEKEVILNKQKSTFLSVVSSNILDPRNIISYRHLGKNSKRNLSEFQNWFNTGDCKLADQCGD